MKNTDGYEIHNTDGFEYVVTEPGNGSKIFDAAGNFSGWLTVKLSPEGGLRFSIRTLDGEYHGYRTPAQAIRAHLS